MCGKCISCLCHDCSVREVFIKEVIFGRGGGVSLWSGRTGELFHGKTYFQSESCNFKIPFRRKLLLPFYNFLISCIILRAGRNAPSTRSISPADAWRCFVGKLLEINTIWLCGTAEGRKPGPCAPCPSSWAPGPACTQWVKHPLCPMKEWINYYWRARGRKEEALEDMFNVSWM